MTNDNSEVWNETLQQGYSSYFEGIKDCPYTDDQFYKAEAWRYGWRVALDEELMGEQQETLWRASL